MNSTDRSPIEATFRPPAALMAAALLAIAVGVAGLAIGFGTAPRDAWAWLLVNFVFFGGIANGVLVWSAAFRVAQTRWTCVVNRLGHSTLAYMPVLLLVLIGLLSGARQWAPWVRHPIRHPQLHSCRPNQSCRRQPHARQPCHHRASRPRRY